MEENKNRYELIVGFISLVLAFSAFKDELKTIEVDVGFYKFTLADYLLKIVYGFGISMYLYILERVARYSKRLSTWKIINLIEKIAFFLFVFIILTPILLLLIVIVYKIFNSVAKLDHESNSIISGIVSTILGLISGIITSFINAKYFKNRRKLRREKIEKEEIEELEKAMKLYENKFYSQAILEAFKVLEIRLIKLLHSRQINVNRSQFTLLDLMNYAYKLELIDRTDFDKINEIRKMRNSAAHLDVEHTKDEATKVIEFIKYLIEKTSNDNNKD